MPPGLPTQSPNQNKRSEVETSAFFESGEGDGEYDRAEYVAQFEHVAGHLGPQGDEQEKCQITQ